MDTHLCYDRNDDTLPAHAVVTDWLACGLERAGPAPALRFVETQLSYDELERRSNQVAHRLNRLGVQRGDRVGLCMDRSVEMIVVFIAILKCGAAYVPLDPTYPVQRLGMMKEDAALRLLVVHAAHAELFDDQPDKVIRWETVEAKLQDEPVDPVGIHVDSEDVAYVIFTSGSTGRPKGIAMPHRALSNLIEWQLERRTFKPAARVLQYSSISFDVSFQEIATTFASGGTLVLVSDQDRRDPRRLLELLAGERIDRLFLPYVAMRSMIEAAHGVGLFPESLKEVITAGEQLRVDHEVRDFFAKIGGASLDNQYGPSETHVITAHLLEGDPKGWPDLPPIGTALRNNTVYILDERMRPVDVGVEGEIYLAGRNLAHGYLLREEITRKVFIPNPLNIPERPILYKTGDLGAYNTDGSVNYLGRKDHQVKLRGHRVEPGEINAAAARFPGIEQCLTHAVVGTKGGTRLVSWYVSKAGSTVDLPAFRHHLSDALPDYMMPAFLVEIDGVPYTPSGKVDYKALPRPNIRHSRYDGKDVHYETETERAIAGIWGELLDLDHIPRTADFFEIGGDSLQAVTLFLRIQQRFDRDLPLSMLARTPTLAGLARLIDGEDDDLEISGFRSLQVIQRGDGKSVPLFLIHGGQGNVLIFKDLAGLLGPHQQVCGFQWGGWDGMRAEQTIVDMARAYKEELLRFYPAGPYKIGGNCIGALIAVELANLLKAEGRIVDGPLIIWDAPNLGSPAHRLREPWGREDEMKVFERMKKTLSELGDGKATGTIKAAPAARTSGFIGFLKRIPGLHALELRLKALPKILSVQHALWRGRPVPVNLRAFYCLQTMIAAVKPYRSPGYDGDMLYFRSYSVLGRNFSLPGWWDDPYLGFSELCRGRFEAYVVGREHNTVLRAPEPAQILKKHVLKEDSE